MAPRSRLKILLVSAEISPLANTGGLADVTSSLSAYFQRQGHDCRVLVPLRAGIDTSDLDIEEMPELSDLELQLGGRSVQYTVVRTQLPHGGPEVYLLRCPELYFRQGLYSGPDEHLRFILLSRAAIEICQRMPFAPDLFHCHDWHAALVPVYLKTRYAWDALFARSKTVLTLHNIGFQGVFGANILYEMGLADAADMLDAEDLQYDRINFLKTGVIHADLLTTVSPTHAREILEPGYGMGLDGHLRERSASLVGILNGVDSAEWNPADDPHIPHPFAPGRMEGKEQDKQAVMHELGLDYVFDRPLLGMVTRLDYQKGIDLLQGVLPELLQSRDFALAVLGAGEAHHERFFQWMHAEHSGRVSFYQGVDVALAHRIVAGSDIYLMPSRYEPCGMHQMYGLRYGTVPVVRATGGLTDSVRHFDPSSGSGTGVVFHDFDANGLRWAVNTALDLYANKHDWRRVVHNAMQQNYSWEEQGALYERAFRKLLQ